MIYLLAAAIVVAAVVVWWLGRSRTDEANAAMARRLSRDHPHVLPPVSSGRREEQPEARPESARSNYTRPWVAEEKAK